MLSQSTTFLATKLCGGSSRKLIAGWWYSILALAAALMVMSVSVFGQKNLFCGLYTSIILVSISIGGTMIMRKFHNSMAVGFFMGCILGASQLLFTNFLVFLEENVVMGILSLLQSILLGSFAAILSAHRSHFSEEEDEPSLDGPSLDGPSLDEPSLETADSSYDPPTRA